MTFELPRDFTSACFAPEEVGSHRIAFTAKGWHDQVGRNHNDVDSFILNVNSVQLLCDPGSGRYTRQYFEPSLRYPDIPCGSHGHSLPIIYGQFLKMDNCFRATDFSFIETDAAAGFRCDIAGTYGQPYLPELPHLY